MIPLAGGGGAGGPLPFPPGDPGAVRAAAGALAAAARTVGSAVDNASANVEATLSNWVGSAAGSFSAAAKGIQGGTVVIASGSAAISAALNAYADVLEEGQNLARKAQQTLAEAQQALAGGLASANNDFDAAATAAANNLNSQASTLTAQAQAAQAAACSQYDAASASASAAAQQAVEMVQQAANLTAIKVRAVTAEIRSASVHDWATAVGAAGVGFEGAAGLGISMALRDLLGARSTLRSGDWEAISKLDPKAWEEVDKFAEENGAESLATLAKAYSYEEEAGTKAVDGAVNSLGSFGSLASDEGALATSLDVVGKVGVGVGLVGDALTFADWNGSTTADKVVAGANVLGVAGAAAGTEMGGVVLGMVGVDSVAGWVPVAGQVLIGATALAAAGLWVYENWDSVSRFASNVGNDVVDAGSDVLHAAEWVDGQEIQVASDVVSSGLHLASAAADEAGSIASSAASTVEHAGASVIKTGSHLVSDAENLVSDLNPF